jgi:cytochrome c1
MHYNPFFPGGQIAMTPPLSEGIVTYSDGSQPNVNQMAKDVVAFLSWAAEPELEESYKIFTKKIYWVLNQDFNL